MKLQLNEPTHMMSQLSKKTPELLLYYNQLRQPHCIESYTTIVLDSFYNNIHTSQRSTS